jgi:hypothetical protein
MNWLKKLLAYPLIFFGIVFLAAALSAPFDGQTKKDELSSTVLGCLLLSAATGSGGVALLRSTRSEQNKMKAQALETEQERLRSVLYKLIEEHKGEFTLVQFAIAADIPPKVAQDFLNQQAMAFNASFDVSEQGSIVYQFPVS